jgi:hypothetical protein
MMLAVPTFLLIRTTGTRVDSYELAGFHQCRRGKFAGRHGVGLAQILETAAPLDPKAPQGEGRPRSPAA